MNLYAELRYEVIEEIRKSFGTEDGQIANLLLRLLPLVPEDDEVVVFIPCETAEELKKFKDCYAPLLREVANLCDSALCEF